MTTTMVKQPERTTYHRTAGIPFPRLVSVELRKLTNTRAGAILLALNVLVGVVVMFILAFTGHNQNHDLGHYVGNMLVPMSFLLPILGILLVTSEWSQHTALTTFGLTPDRGRVMRAKALSCVLIAVAATAVALLCAVSSYLLATASGGHGGWHLDPIMVATGLLYEVAEMLIGFALGLALMNSPLAIVIYLLVPTVLQLVRGLVSSLAQPMLWVDSSSALSVLTDTGVSGTEWGRVATSLLVWLALPLAFGVIRLARQDIK